MDDAGLHDSGLLDVGDGNRIAWEVQGNPEGQPALVVHGGPGSGRPANTHRSFDHDIYRVVLFDQRGCGESVPSAADPATDMSHNTTWHLLADMERLREHLGIERWLLFGGSWASTLILLYAERHPDRVSAVVLAGVTMTTPDEIDWLYRGLGRLLPAEWERFRSGVPEHERAADLVDAYRRLMESPDPVVRDGAAAAWCRWEDAAIGHEVMGRPGQYSAKTGVARDEFVRICTHYFAHRAWLDDGQILRDAHRLHGIPGVLLHGRLDLASPLSSAWQLAKAWPDATLTVMEDTGHTGSPGMRTEISRALTGFA
jgi:proline iminopeptidase